MKTTDQKLPVGELREINSTLLYLTIMDIYNNGSITCATLEIFQQHNTRFPEALKKYIPAGPKQENS